ncbi:hypothetical protein SAMN05444050_5217 [Afipia sp. GAS231]|nr:hypothetical protein SAMN05444050_5217 [Afipia sp. GAS231]
MAGHSRLKDGVASARLCPGHPRLKLCRPKKDVDARDIWREDALRASARASRETCAARFSERLLSPLRLGLRPQHRVNDGLAQFRAQRVVAFDERQNGAGTNRKAVALVGIDLFSRRWLFQKWLCQKSVPSVAKSDRTGDETAKNAIVPNGPPVERTLNSYSRLALVQDLPWFKTCLQFKARTQYPELNSIVTLDVTLNALRLMHYA